MEYVIDVFAVIGFAVVLWVTVYIVVGLFIFRGWGK